MDLNQLYTVLFCLWFLALGAIEYLVLRWVGVAGFRSNAKTRRARLSGRDCGSLYEGARRQIEGPGEDAGKGLLRIEAIPGRYRRPADRCHADRGRPAASFREYSAPGSPLYTVKQPLQMPFRIPGMASDIINTQRLMQVVINPLDDSINHLSGNRHMLSPLIPHWRLAPPGVK